jgi:hypothetical protein
VFCGEVLASIGVGRFAPLVGGVPETGDGHFAVAHRNKHETGDLGIEVRQRAHEVDRLGEQLVIGDCLSTWSDLCCDDRCDAGEADPSTRLAQCLYSRQSSNSITPFKPASKNSGACEGL